ncbi:MAG: hypothetical protein CMJ83_19360 [Planctomycetes bacterium]|nr:hypothetical protein [Planctomycetota bacterium]
MTRSALALLSILVIVPTGAHAQADDPLVADGRALLLDVVASFGSLQRNRDPLHTRLADQQLERLRALETMPPELREKACRFLKRILEMKGREDSLYRLRVTAIRLIAKLAHEVSWAKYLARVALARKGSPMVGLDFYVERNLANLRTPAHAKWLLTGLQDSRRSIRRLVLGALARLDDPKRAAMLLPALDRLCALAGDDDKEIASRAVAVLGQIESSRVFPPLVRAVTDGSALVRLAAAQALGRRLHVPGTVPVLARLLEDTNARVREECVISFRRAKDKAIVPRLIARMSKEPLRLRAALAKTLQHLVGHGFGLDPKPWQDWLKSARAAGNLDLDRGARATPRGRYASQYYGIPVLSDRVLFILDVSRSMDYRAGLVAKSRLARAKQELTKALRGLDKKSYFGVMAFSSSPLPLQRNGLVRVSERSIKRAVKWIGQQGAQGGTNSYGALELAFDKFPKVDTIYFLSDGSPTLGRTIVQERIIQRVAKWNRLRGVRIHTIALLTGDTPAHDVWEDKQDAQRFMRALAEETGGEFLIIK